MQMMMRKDSRNFCGEYQGFGGDCVSEEELKETWLAYYEVSRVINSILSLFF